ncbi:MAG: hypothetical protein COZ09_10095 [Comamonadaceae bacterium CG_4_10_14_3_um_filter_60_42]|nr:MAG: hypothetical protein COZ09_10095 [Comamonadaceae bacterium CG_4_10_14_3_um_filter_60_42]
MSNPWTSAGGNLTGLAKDIIPVTPANDADIAVNTVAVGIICKGNAGDVVIITASGNERTYPIASEETLPVGVSRVKATGTTATGIWAFLA